MYAVLTLVLLVQPAPKESTLDPLIVEAVKPNDKDTPLRKLQRERVRERAEALAKIRVSINAGRWGSELLGEYVKLQTIFAEQLAELLDKPADKVKCYEMRVENLKEFERIIKARAEGGLDRPESLNLAKAARIDAEIDLLKLKGPAVGGNDPDALMREVLAGMLALASALEKKESAEKIKAAALKLNATSEKLDALRLGKEEKAKLEEKYKNEMLDAFTKLSGGVLGNPEGAKILNELKKATGDKK